MGCEQSIEGIDHALHHVRALLAVLLLVAGVQLAFAERTTTYFHTDGLGSVVAATNQSGAVLWRKTYAPYGEQTDTQADNERLSFTGKPHDDAIGLTYFGGRYYDPAIGRFASVDPDGEFLNFAAKFVLDVGINVAFNYATTGEFGVGSALKESAVGILNPAKTVAKAGKLARVLAKVEKRLPPPCKLRCFAAGTTVPTDHGFVAIETLEVGDLVWAYDPDTDQSALKPILKTGVNTKDSIWHLTLVKGGETYRHEVTGSHPYYLPTDGWVEVAHLRVGSELLTEGGETAIVTGVYDTGQVQTTYNLEVADINTYYVSAARVLVHNCGNTGIPGRGYHIETTSPTPVNSRDATDKWDEFLGPGPHSNTHPRTGLPDKDRIVSSDGRRSVRYGDHEMNSSPNKHHYHEETWTHDPVNNITNVDNKIVRIK